ncbi:DUF4326 domain-containing protein [Streptomyces sp. CBMA152]|uniref:DUF4326 domain-containing protein n=1 Tax=Streptomyces sp. CBMA152 TaxID=1896312 RepID=UPI00166094D5|nr:DUF4326 domain-containing protein [Streptomyces sp. CBMA152]MBD0743525.1 hypothetical protein [Streptomyces sp. CBMA152]
MSTRIQRKRQRGWTAPLDAEGRRPVYVGRGSRWGNPWAVAQTPHGWAASWTAGDRAPAPPDGKRWVECDTRYAAHETAVYLYAEWIADQPVLLAAIRSELADRDVMCWCARALPCHGDVHLAVAAGEDPHPDPLALARVINRSTP